MGSPYEYTDSLVVVIATSGGRTDILLRRALRSVYLQEGVVPHHIYIVDDNPKEGKGRSNEFKNIKRGVSELREEILRARYEAISEDKPKEFAGYFHTSVIPNTRTVGCSGTGAWNTAAMRALQIHTPVPGNPGRR